VSLSADGTIVAFGEPRYSISQNLAYGYGSSSIAYVGRARVFELSFGNWVQVAELLSYPSQYRYFGYKVSLSADGTRIAVSDSGNQGLVKLFQNTDGSWVQDETDLVGESSSDAFGDGLSMAGYGGALVVGAPGRNTNGGDDSYYGSTATGGTGTAYFFGSVEISSITEQPTSKPTNAPTNAPTQMATNALTQKPTKAPKKRHNRRRRRGKKRLRGGN
jgi:hypothetical protein